MGLSENRAAAKSSGYHYFFIFLPYVSYGKPAAFEYPPFSNKAICNNDDLPSSQELVVGEGKGFWAGVSDAQF